MYDIVILKSKIVQKIITIKNNIVNEVCIWKLLSCNDLK